MDGKRGREEPRAVLPQQQFAVAAKRSPGPHLLRVIEQLLLPPVPPPQQAQQDLPLGATAAQRSKHHLVSHARKGAHPAAWQQQQQGVFGSSRGLREQRAGIANWLGLAGWLVLSQPAQLAAKTGPLDPSSAELSGGSAQRHAPSRQLRQQQLLTRGVGSTPCRTPCWCTSRRRACRAPLTPARQAAKRPSTCRQWQVAAAAAAAASGSRASVSCLASSCAACSWLSQPPAQNAPPPHLSPQAGAELSEVEGEQEGAAGAQAVPGDDEAVAVAAPAWRQQGVVQHAVLLNVQERGSGCL